LNIEEELPGSCLSGTEHERMHAVSPPDCLFVKPALKAEQGRFLLFPLLWQTLPLLLKICYNSQRKIDALERKAWHLVTAS
jgi:hypothetical protein